MTERPTDGVLDTIVGEQRDAGLLTIGTDAQGALTWTPRPQGEQVATQMAMSSEDDALELLTALLDAAEADTCERPAPRETGLSSHTGTVRCKVDRPCRHRRVSASWRRCARLVVSQR